MRSCFFAIILLFMPMQAFAGKPNNVARDFYEGMKYPRASDAYNFISEAEVFFIKNVVTYDGEKITLILNVDADSKEKDELYEQYFDKAYLGMGMYLCVLSSNYKKEMKDSGFSFTLGIERNGSYIKPSKAINLSTCNKFNNFEAENYKYDLFVDFLNLASSDLWQRLKDRQWKLLSNAIRNKLLVLNIDPSAYTSYKVEGFTGIFTTDYPRKLNTYKSVLKSKVASHYKDVFCQVDALKKPMQVFDYKFKEILKFNDGNEILIEVDKYFCN